MKEESKKLQNKTDNIVQKIVRMEYQMSLFETKEDADRKFDILLTAIDGLTKKVTDFQTEIRSSERTFQRHEEKLENHEKRIDSLEMSLEG